MRDGRDVLYRNRLGHEKAGRGSPQRCPKHAEHQLTVPGETVDPRRPVHLSPSMVDCGAAHATCWCQLTSKGQSAFAVRSIPGPISAHQWRNWASAAAAGRFPSPSRRRGRFHFCPPFVGREVDRVAVYQTSYSYHHPFLLGDLGRLRSLPCSSSVGLARRMTPSVMASSATCTSVR